MRLALPSERLSNEKRQWLLALQAFRDAPMFGSLGKLGRGIWYHRWLAVAILVLIGCLGFGGTSAYRHARAEWNYRLAMQALERRDFSQAQANLAICLEVWPTSAETHFQMARAARRAGAYDDAQRYLRECQRLGGVADAIELERALLRAQRGDLAKVEGNLLACAQQGHPDAVLILEALAHGNLKTFSLTHARHCLQLWLEREPDSIQALLWQGEVNRRRYSHQDALSDYRRILALDPDHAEARLRLAEILAHTRQPEEAIEHFQWLLDREPANPTALLGLARCQHLLGNPVEALRLLDTLLNASPDHADALSVRGEIALECGQPADAEIWLRRAVSLKPYEYQPTYSLCQCLRQQHKLAEAEKYQGKAKEIDAQQRRVGELLRQIGETPHDPALRHEVGAIILRSGQVVDGLRWLDSALQEDPDFPPAHQILADYYESIGDRVEAARHRAASQTRPSQAGWPRPR
jgi:predicted Zn-dependent protease